MIDNYRGCLLGLAVGDAVGTTNEFSFYNRFITHESAEDKPITDMLGGGPFNLNVGQWTDDTSMALCLADSLLAKDGFDAKDQLERYVRWYKDGHNSCTGTCFDIGTTTRQSLEAFIRTGKDYPLEADRNLAGNGSLMRLAPVILFYAHNDDYVVFYAGYSSRTTHPAPQAVDSCRYFARLVRDVLINAGAEYPKTKKELLDVNIDDLQLDGEVIAAALMDYSLLEKKDINPSGYVVDSLKAALFCFTNTDNFRDGCLMATNMGGDADTIAAIYGQVAGAYYGMKGIPQDWLDKLAWREKIQTIADNLYKARMMYT